jgi:hypothetical protein
MSRLALVVLAGALGLAGCGVDGDSDLVETGEQIALGPVDGHDLPGVDLDRVQVGDLAPDFSLVSLAGPVVTLSDFRGEKNVILVFYRGYW